MTWLLLARPFGLVAALPLIGGGAPLVPLAAALILASWLALAGGPPAGATFLGELAIGLMLGLTAVGPVWAARLTGVLGDRAADRARDEDPLERLYTLVGLATFAICGGPTLLVAALVKSREMTPTLDLVASLGRTLLLGLELAAPLLAAGLIAGAARLAVARWGARSLVIRHRILSFALVTIMVALAMSGQIAAVARAFVTL